MLKPMNQKPSPNIFIWIAVGVLVLGGIIVLALAFRGNKNKAEKEIVVAYTSAAQTFEAQLATLQASSPSPTQEATQTAQATPTLLATLALPPTAFPTLAAPPTNPSVGGMGSGAVGCANSAFVADVTVPDHSAMTPGQTFTKTWRLQNSGSCEWTPSFKVTFLSGNAMGAATTALPTTVQPGASGDISIQMTAPTNPGEAQGTWILTNENGQNFGTNFYVVINVGGTAVTGTAGTPIAVGTSATSSTAIATPIAANNPVVSLPCAANGSQYEYTGTLTWEDKSDNEQGFNIYISGVPGIADIAPANTTSYQIKKNARVTNVLYDAGTVITYSVEAFNAGGKSPSANVTGQCP